MTRKSVPLFLIVLLAAFLRLIALGKIPAGISPDEVSQGYTAYSLLKTGHDEWGTPFPLTSFRSFLDYKAPLQTYLILPSIAVFGLTEFAIRLPSAILGILAILAVYLLTKELFKSEKTALFAALFLAISPWHLQFSRTALEVNITSLLFPLGLLFFIKGLKKPPLLYLAVTVWGLNLYSYHAAKLFEPSFILSALIIYRHSIVKIPRKILLTTLLLGALFITPILISSVFGSGASRANDLLVTRLGKESLNEISLIQFNSPLRKLSPLLPRLFSNKLTYITSQFVANITSYFSPSFWFTEGGRETTYSVLPGTGLLYLFLFPLVFLGLYTLLKNRHKNLPILCLWLAAGILPAALTKEGYRPNRVGSLLAFWEIIAAFGLVTLIAAIKVRHRFVVYFIAAICTLSVIFYLNTYFFEYPYRFPNALSYGYRDLVSTLSIYPPSQAIIIDRGSNSQTFISFYEKIDPKIFQSFSRIWWEEVKKTHPLYLDQLEEYHLQNYVFKNFNPSVDLIRGNIIVIPASKYMDPYLPLIQKIITYPDKTPAFYILSR